LQSQVSKEKRILSLKKIKKFFDTHKKSDTFFSYQKPLT
jgi:hypothetical protein